MKKLVTSALALSLTGASGFASENDWSQLDKEVEALTSSLAQEGGPALSGFIQAVYAHAGGIPGPDVGGFAVPNARLELEGDVADYSYRIEYNFAGGPLLGNAPGTGTLLDAFMNLPIGDITGTVGQFKPPALRSSLVDRDKLFFFDRTVAGESFAGRDQGAMVSGQFEQVAWWLALMNGGDGLLEDLFFIARASIDFLGEGVNSTAEGTYGGTDDPSGTASLAYFNDEFSNSRGVLVDAHVSSNIYSFGGEILVIEDQGTPATAQPFFAGSGSQFALPAAIGFGALAPDSTPFAVYGTYMLTPDTWEVGVRFQNVDDGTPTTVGDTTKIDIGLNYYLEGHDLKWTAQYTRLDADAPAGGVDPEIDALIVGLLMSF